MKSSAFGLDGLMVIPLMEIGGGSEEFVFVLGRDHVCIVSEINLGDILGSSGRIRVVTEVHSY